MDADNLVYPSALRKLSSALDHAPDAAFSYGIINKIGQQGLLSYLPWDVERLTEGNYIDGWRCRRQCGTTSANMTPTSAFEAGRTTSSGAIGRCWGLCRFVPEIVGCYRVHSTSRQPTVNLDTAPLMSDFRDLYPFLPWNEP